MTPGQSTAPETTPRVAAEAFAPAADDPWRAERFVDRYETSGFEILVGRSAAENDRLSLREARPTDVWLHAAGYAGSHVVVRAREGKTGEVPREVIEQAALLAIRHSKARNAGGKVPVHICRGRDVSKRRGAPPGQVVLARYDTLRIYPRDPGA
jgi:predicted ribosome quality control (RQC) complex YloA/Tae2 family protein